MATPVRCPVDGYLLSEPGICPLCATEVVDKLTPATWFQVIDACGNKGSCYQLEKTARRVATSIGGFYEPIEVMI